MTRGGTVLLTLSFLVLHAGRAEPAEPRFVGSEFQYVPANAERGVLIWNVKPSQCYRIYQAGGIACFNDGENANWWRAKSMQFSQDLLIHAASHLAEGACRRRFCGAAIDALHSVIQATSGHDRQRADVRSKPGHTSRSWAPGGAFTVFRPGVPGPTGSRLSNPVWIRDHLEIAWSEDYYYPGVYGDLYLFPNDKDGYFWDNTGFYWIRLDIFETDPQDRIRYYELPEDD